MREILTEIEVDAPPADVWAVLTDLPAYEAWNPHVVSATVEGGGDLRAGARIRIRVDTGDGTPRGMRATVETVDPERALSWVGSIGGPWLWRGRHTVELHPLAGGRTRVVNREELTGLLVGLLVPADAHRGYEAANRALSARVAAPDSPTGRPADGADGADEAVEGTVADA